MILPQALFRLSGADSVGRNVLQLMTVTQTKGLIVAHKQPRIRVCVESPNTHTHQGNPVPCGFDLLDSRLSKAEVIFNRAPCPSRMMPMPTKMSRRGSMPGRLQRRASLSAAPSGQSTTPMMPGEKKGPPQRLMISWFQASETVEELVPEPPSPPVEDSSPEPTVVEHVQITGLELLKKDSKYKEDQSDDFSYESYARDSVALAGKKVKKIKAKSPTTRLTQSEHPKRREIDMEDEDGVDSMARDYYDYDYDYRTADLEKEIRRWTPRRASIGSFVDSYVGSYANDSVEYQKYKSTRRSSVGSYANDSVGYKNLRSSTRGANAGALGVSWHGQNRYRRRSSLGRRGSLGRRSSLGSNTMDSSTGRRYPCRGGVMRRHSSHCCEVGLMRKSLDGPIMRRSSLGSVSSGVSLSVATSLSMSTAFSRAA